MACVESDVSMMYESEFEDNVFDNSDDDFENVAPPKKGSKPAPKKSKDAINMVLSPSKNAGNVPAAAAAEKGNKKSVEQMYQKKTQLEHILLRPDTYIGSVEPLTTPMFVLDQETKKIVNRQVTYTPGLYKIFDESEYT
jgi:DNA topoisomerase-2